MAAMDLLGRHACTWGDCDRSYMSAEQLAVHVGQHERGEIPERKPTETEANTCKHCGFVAASPAGLRGHSVNKHGDRTQGRPNTVQFGKPKKARHAGAVSRTSAARAVGGDDTPEHRSGDAGSSPAPRSQSTASEGEGAGTMAETKLCSVPECAKAGKLAGHKGKHRGEQAVRGVRSSAGGGTGPGKAGRPRKQRAPATAPVSGNGDLGKVLNASYSVELSNGELGLLMQMLEEFPVNVGETLGHVEASELEDLALRASALAKLRRVGGA